ncbi:MULTISPECIES: MFS transporter [Kitasatospora]|uniref:MFS transporter n=1 Tax=Kitasatospora TaxID=2063 RepID=UPI0002E15C7A|nr:MFS transporter [Kitasatospora setae]
MKAAPRPAPAPGVERRGPPSLPAAAGACPPITERTTAAPAPVPAGTAAAPPGAPHRATLPVILAGVFLAGLDFFIVNVAVPALQHDLRATDAQIQLVVAAYALAYGVGMVTGGRLGDLFPVKSACWAELVPRAGGSSRDQQVSMARSHSLELQY